jgi:hypothetical protein
LIPRDGEGKVLIAGNLFYNRGKEKRGPTLEDWVLPLLLARKGGRGNWRGREKAEGRERAEEVRRRQQCPGVSRSSGEVAAYVCSERRRVRGSGGRRRG